MKCEVYKLTNPQEVTTLPSIGKLAILYAPCDTFLDYAHICQQTFKDIELIGCSTHKNLSKDGFITEALLVFLSDINIATYCLKDIGTYPILHIQEVEKTLNKLPKSSKESTFCFSLCTFTSHEEMVMNTLEQLLTSYDIDLMGGTAAADDKGVSYVLLNDVIETDACILTFIQNKSGRVKLYKENIFHPTNTWFIATDVDVDKRLLKTLEYFSNIYKNATLCKMQLGDYKAINEETVSTILKDIPHPSGALAINCILRTIQFENEHFNTDFAANLSKLGTFAGFSSFGEQIHYHHCNQTLVLAVFE